MLLLVCFETAPRIVCHTLLTISTRSPFPLLLLSPCDECVRRYVAVCSGVSLRRVLMGEKLNQTTNDDSDGDDDGINRRDRARTVYNIIASMINLKRLQGVFFPSCRVSSSVCVSLSVAVQQHSRAPLYPAQHYMSTWQTKPKPIRMCAAASFCCSWLSCPFSLPLNPPSRPGEPQDTPALPAIRKGRSNTPTGSR